MPSLRAVQEEMRSLVFFRGAERTDSFLWGGAIPDRLRIYRNNTRTNWADTLDWDFRLTRKQFSPEAWEGLRARYFAKHPAGHWELNASMAPFVKFIAAEPVEPRVKELADYEWHDLKIFIDRADVRKASGLTNPTAIARVYRHQIFYWVEAEAPKEKPPRQKPEVLVFFRDSKNTTHIMEADPLMLLMMEHFRRPGASLDGLEPIRERLLPQNKVPLSTVLEALKGKDLILV